MRILNFNDLHLAEHSGVEGHLLSSELRQNSLAQVARKQVSQLLHRFDLPIEISNFIGHRTGIRLVLEKSSDRLLAGSYVREVLLGVTLLLLKLPDGFFAIVALVDSLHQRHQIKDLAFSPVEDINVRILQSASDIVHAAEDSLVVRVRQDQPFGVHVRVVLQIHLLVPAGSPVQVLI